MSLSSRSCSQRSFLLAKVRSHIVVVYREVEPIGLGHGLQKHPHRTDGVGIPVVDVGLGAREVDVDRDASRRERAMVPGTNAP